ncbi:hotdog fold thioesterase [Aliikangiella sp. IMCC44359]|uniref:hotdog fold thioesterase n=1 Tax=Aliikangiella sp. IMCC44359 TaxID=3459125 RepID=UPI00403B2FBF
MSIWKKEASLDYLQQSRAGTLVEHIGIEFTEVGDDYLIASMPVDHRTFQPFNILHGGASIVLAETVGSVAANLVVGNDYYCVGLEVNGNHLRQVTEGSVYAKATAAHIGRSTHVWEIKITDDKGKNVCISRLTMAVLKKG